MCRVHNNVLHKGFLAFSPICEYYSPTKVSSYTVDHTSDHECPDASLSESGDDWSCLRLETVLHDDQPSQGQVTFHQLPVHVVTYNRTWYIESCKLYTN